MTNSLLQAKENQWEQYSSLRIPMQNMLDTAILMFIYGEGSNLLVE